MGMEDDDSDVEAGQVPKPAFTTTHEAKLGELLHRISSNEIKLCKDAAKEFIKLLKGSDGAELLALYVRASPNLSELLGDWKSRQGRPAFRYILSLVSSILGHEEGKYKANDKERVGVSRIIDKFARSFIEEKLDIVYKELSSKEGKRQNVALSLMASIVRRGSGLASDVAKSFNFKLKEFSKLAGFKQRQKFEKDRKHSTRKAFVRFAMSFLEVGKPGLLRWVLQQREMFSGILRGLENDDDETVVYVLSTLRDRVLAEESLVPPALRSVLFGSVTLEQLVGISGRESGGAVAELAYRVLVMVCTDPANGLMPDLQRQSNPLRGNPKRLLGLMKKLNATEIGYHRDLLLSIVRGRLSLGSAYLEEFPYNLEDFASPTWFDTVCLAASVISSVGANVPRGLQSNSELSFDSMDVQNIMKCISPRTFSRSVINKGLLHSEFLVKNGTLRLLLEALKLLDSFLRSINLSSSGETNMHGWDSIKQEIQNEIRTLLPDLQVFLTLLSSLNAHTRNDRTCLKRTADSECISEYGRKATKRLKTDMVNEDMDIVIAGISPAPEVASLGDSENVVDEQLKDELDGGKDFLNVFSELWGSDLCLLPVNTLKDAEILFHSKLLDALKIYLLADGGECHLHHPRLGYGELAGPMMPTALDGSFEFFMNLLSNPLELPTTLQSSVMSLLVELINWSPRQGVATRTPPLMYKHLQTFLNLLLFSPIGDIKLQAYHLARAAMSSTGAFDRNMHEIVAWLLFLPGYNLDKSAEVKEIEVLQSFSPIVISFLCDAVSTVGNNLFRYWEVLRDRTCHLKEFKDVSPEFSPLIICVLQKCLRLLSSDSGTFSLPEKSMISAYVCSTLKYLLQNQVDAVLLSGLLRLVLSEGLTNSAVADSTDFICEWVPMKNLLTFAESVWDKKTCCVLSFENTMLDDGSFMRTLDEVRRIVESGDSNDMPGIVKAFSSSIMCSPADGLLKNFPLVMTISQHLRLPESFLSWIVYLEPDFLAGVLKLWPTIFFSGLEMAISMIDPQGKDVAEDIICNIDSGGGESAAAAAFSLFLRQASFSVLFPGIISMDIHHLPELSKIKNLLLAKLCEVGNDCAISSLRLLLFWFYQIRSAYMNNPFSRLEQHAEVCYDLVKHVVARLLVLKSHSECPADASITLLAVEIQEVATTIFCHPAVVASVTRPLSCTGDFTDRNYGDSLEAFVCFSGQTVHKIDGLALSMLATTFEYLLAPSGGPHLKIEVGDNARKRLLKNSSNLIQRLCLEFRHKFDQYIRNGNLLPLLSSFYALHSLSGFISPVKLLELSHWIFGRVDMNNVLDQRSRPVPALAIGFCVASDAFKNLSSYLLKLFEKREPYYYLWEIEGNNWDVNLMEVVYLTLCKFAVDFKLDFAFTCLLEAVNVVYRQKDMQNNILHPFSLVLSRVVVSTPVEILSHCFWRTSVTKAKLLTLLVDLSPVHLSSFGHLFLGILDKEGKMMKETCTSALSDSDFILLLPAALSFMNAVLTKFGKQHHRQFANITSFYSKILLNGFCRWKSFVTEYFNENYDKFPLSSVEELINLVGGSILGKGIHMLRHHFVLHGDMEMEERLKVFNSVLSGSDNNGLLDCDDGDLEPESCNQLLNLISMIVAKISLCRMLLFPEDHHNSHISKEGEGSLNQSALDIESDEDSQSRMHFLKCLVYSWQRIVKKFPLLSDGSGEKNQDHLQVYRYLELFILRTIFELTTNMRDILIQLQSIPFLKTLVRASLLCRFGDPTTLRILRNVLTLLLEGKFSCTSYLQLLLAHSQFASSVHCGARSSRSQIGAFVKPMSSILRSLSFSRSNSNNNLQTEHWYLKQLEIVKLLRILLRKLHQSGCDLGKDICLNLKELHLLLLSSYGATLSENDLQIYSLMREIESIDKTITEEVVEMDYLWGTAALKIREERTLDQETANITLDPEAIREHQRSQFRENLPVDPRICAATVLHFPYDRNESNEPLPLGRLQLDNPKDVSEACSPSVGNVLQYDPVFILRFSIHALTVCYIEPMEFAGLGLLAVAFVSMSSPDLGVRKLGYECLGRYKNALEKCQKKKDVMRLRLLLTYLQNGIEEPWQRIPSVIALFAADSSFILLDPSHDYYATLCKHLMRSSKVNMKRVPLFHSLFQSESSNIRTERLWMIRLVCAGLNLDDDSQMYISNSIVETLLSFFSSPLSDDEVKELILQIVKKSVKLHRMARHLVEYCGLFPWLSSVLSVYKRALRQPEGSFSSKHLLIVTEVVADVISSINMVEWFQSYALEQLTELTTHLYKLLIGGLKSITENVALANSVLNIMISTMKMSQKRKIYQPHLTLSFEGLFHIYQASTACATGRSSSNSELGLKAILMSIPPTDVFHMVSLSLSLTLTHTHTHSQIHVCAMF
ncbi:hypothetical protein Tsubulata_012761 [Turnera subulata]|uniref:Nucleolar pre-ribosomal-associated protein 1 N-terminal domain-containing protein n=1 Tax=Turnera subulata TaxID=218843 RepID=A0A9Q0FTV1_9ROSI|nr:hypothetical protein Tsubulata_012761 [Turnera subulata]